MKIFLLFGVKHDIMRDKNNARTSTNTSLGLPTHPLLLSSHVRFLIPNSCFNFNTMIIVYIMEITSFFCIFVSLVLSFSFYNKTKNTKRFIFLLCLVSFCFFFSLSRKTKTIKRFAFFLFLVWFFLASFDFSFKRFCSLLSLVLPLLVLDF
jgi:hypothetical protein